MKSCKPRLHMSWKDRGHRIGARQTRALAQLTELPERPCAPGPRLMAAIALLRPCAGSCRLRAAGCRSCRTGFRREVSLLRTGSGRSMLCAQVGSERERLAKKPRARVGLRAERLSRVAERTRSQAEPQYVSIDGLGFCKRGRRPLVRQRTPPDLNVYGWPYGGACESPLSVRLWFPERKSLCERCYARRFSQAGPMGFVTTLVEKRLERVDAGRAPFRIGLCGGRG